MNSFREPKSFLVRASVDELLEADRAFFETALEVRRRLGKKAYLLDSYLALVLKSVNFKHSMLESVDDGRNSFGEVRRMARDIFEGGADEKRNDALYNTIRDAVARYKEQFQDKYTVFGLSCIAGYREVLPEMAQDYIVEITRELSARCDTLQINECFAELGRSAGEELLEKLNGLIRQRFLITPVLDIFLQAFTHQYLSCLLQRDEETCRRSFQLILDEMAEKQDHQSK